MWRTAIEHHESPPVHRVLNLFGEDGSHHQDVLTIIPTPGAMALLGLAGFTGARRRRDGRD